MSQPENQPPAELTLTVVDANSTQSAIAVANPKKNKELTNKQRLTADEEVSRTFATVREMLTDRGLDVSSFDTDRHLEVHEVVEKSHLTNVFEVDVHSAKVRVIYNLNSKYKGQDINKLKKAPVHIDDALMEKGDDKSSEWQFLVITRELPMQGKSGLADESTQIFKIEELLINVARHSLVPRHIPIRSPDEIKKILQIYSLKTPQQLPLIISTDPQARYLALRPGELVRIERPSPSAGTYVLYRCCH